MAQTAGSAKYGEPIGPDIGSLRANPMEPDSVYLVADFTGPSAALSPRALLKGQIARAAALGYEALAAFEFEFTILDESAVSLRDKGNDGPVNGKGTLYLYERHDPEGVVQTCRTLTGFMCF